MSTETEVREAYSMTKGFPECGSMLRLAYRELHIAANGTDEQINALGPVHLLPRPWDPPTCRRAELRAQLWDWLDEVVSWFNREYVWDVAGMIPACWPEHPHQGPLRGRPPSLASSQPVHQARERRVGVHPAARLRGRPSNHRPRQ